MALQVWLPMTKDLRNQGLTPITLSSGTPTYTNGKLGQCLSTGTLNFNVSNNLITSLGSTNIYSIACWCKILNTSTASRWAFMLSSGSGTSRGLWENNSTTVRHWAYSGSGINITTSINTVDGNWHHICFVSNKTNVKLYVDGIYQSEVNNASTTAMTNNTFQLNATDYNFNDFRIYDHCLTPEEVKRIAQGLIVHYPLNRNGWGQENLVQNTYGFNDCCKVNESKMTFSGNTVTMSDSGNTALTYTRVECPVSLTTQDLIDAGNITVSMEVMSPNWSAVSEPTTSNTDLGAIAVTLVTTPSLPSGSQKAYIFRRFNDTSFWKEIPTLENNKWLKFESKPFIPGTSPTTWSSLSSGVDTYCRFGPTLRSNGTVSFRNIKIELGSIATPWCPNSSDAAATTMGLNGTTEYDCSGFCNNGTRTGTFSWTSDTPKYCVSTYFNGSSCIFTELPYLGNEWSYSCWIYSPTSSRSWEGVIMLNTTGGNADLQLGFYTYPRNNKMQNTANGQYNSSIPWTYGVWHHFCGTFDGSNLKTYIDGVLTDTKSITASLLERHMLTIGARRNGTNTYNYYFSGNLCDVRIYATALSATDVKSLYQNCATIGPDGTIYGKIRN